MNNILMVLTLIVLLLIFNYRQKILNFFLKVFVKMKKSLLMITNSIIRFFSVIQKKLEENLKPLNNNNLEDLTPFLSDIERNEVENIQKTYLDSLKYAVQDKNIINIALTGGFGSGKSTIINEFMNSNKGYNYLQISLASFKNENFDDNEKNEKLLETSILQQIIFFEKKKVIKESSFRRIDFSNYKIKSFHALLIILWIYSIIKLFFKTLIVDIPFIEKEDVSFYNINYYDNVIKIIFLLGFFKIIYEAYDKLKNFKLSKLTPNSFEITNNTIDYQLSVFNRNMEEIIYFFEKTDTNIVIIEDIDRFKAETAQRLFSKIRELAVLIKQSKNISQPVKFIYAVKDELLTDEKTKFFDIIIPVLPITDYSNSKNIFIKKLNPFFEPEIKEKIVEKLDKKINDEKIIEFTKDVFIVNFKKIKQSFISKPENTQIQLIDPVLNQFVDPINYLDKSFVAEVSNYVSDMRTIKNICNEYKIYHTIQTTNKSSINSNKLFALVLYKNLFSEDFALIQKGNSNLHKIFSRDINSNLTKYVISTILKTNFDEATKKEDEIEKKVKVLQEHILKDIVELRKVYIFTIIQKIHSENKKVITIEDYNVEDLTDESIFYKLKSASKIKYQYIGDYNVQTKYIGSFKEIEKEINEKMNYGEREKVIKDFHNEVINKLQREINILNHEKNEIENLSIHKLYKRYPTAIEFHIKKIFEIKPNLVKNQTIKAVGKNNNEINFKEELNVEDNIGLILNLIRNEYINEDFPNYLSYFYPGSLTTNDHNLLMKIIDNKQTNFAEKIDNVSNLVEELGDLNFKNNSILVNEIFGYLLLNNNPFLKKSKKLDFFIDKVIEIINIGYGASYLKTNDFVEKFIESNIDNKDIMLSFYDEIINKTDKFLFFAYRNINNEKLFDKIIYDMFEMFIDTTKSKDYFEKLNIDSLLTRYINQKPDFLLNVNKGFMLIEILKYLNIKFEKITNGENLSNLLMDIYKNDLYQINTDNLKLFSQIDEKYNFEEDKFIHTNYSFLSSQKETYLFRRISESMNDYIENVYLKIEEDNKENASLVQELLEFEHIEGKNKNLIIDKGFVGKIKSIAKIKEYSVAESLLNFNKVINSWETILEFTVWEDYDFDIIAEFINNNENYNFLSINELFTNINTYFDEEKEFYDFVYKLISNLKLNEISFKTIFEDSASLKLNTSDIKIDLKFYMNNEKKINSIKELRFDHLIEKNYIDLNKNEFNYLIKNDKKILIKLIEKYKDKFIEEISSYDFEIDFLESLLDSLISINNKLLIVNDKEDLLIYGDYIKPNIANKIIDMFITSNFTNYSSSLFKKLISLNDDDIKKIQFFNFHFKQEDSDFSFIEETLENMGGKFKKIINQENVKFESNEINREFLNILKNNNYISNFRKQKDNLILNY